ncbi:hypothetical protein [Actinoplanes sp. NPDC048796]|uniref:hypothetical protein n=1 Tax=unclassified Actinoplanes TaxID=2626549 RepID=UPI0033EF06F3
MRIPTFSRQTETDTTETPTQPAATSPVRPRQDPDVTKAERKLDPPPPPPSVGRPTGSAVVDKTPPRRVDRDEPPTLEQKKVEPTPVVPAGPKPRASLLATLGLVLGVASVFLVLSGPLLGYGIGVAGLALILSLSGIHATGKRHVAGKSDALLGMVFSLGAIVLGILALTGSLNWLGTDTQPVNNFRDWLDARFVDRF